MPTICKKDTCRNPAVYGFCFRKPLYCSDHREEGSKNTRFIEKTEFHTEKQSPTKCIQCPSKTLLPRYKGYCNQCYTKIFPLDPLSLQTTYKSKIVVVQKFIDSKFDGFIHKNEYSQIRVNNFTLVISFGELDIAEDEKTIIIRFNPNKYENGKNPMLYTRLPDLEKEIGKQFDRIMNG